MAKNLFTRLVINLSKRYSSVSFAVQVRVRITFGLLLCFMPIIIIAFMPSLLTRPGSKLGLIITLVSGLSFFGVLIFLLKRGLRETTNTALTAGLFLIIIMTYVTGAPNYDSTGFLDRFVAVALMQLAMCVLISEKRRYLLILFLAYLVAIVLFLFLAQLPIIPERLYGELSGNYLRDIVILSVGFVSLLFINIVTHRTINLHALSEERLSKLNNDLEILVNERTSRLILTEKKNSVNILVAGINHQLNTPLGNIVTTVSSLQQQSLIEAFSSGLKGEMFQKLLSSLRLIDENAGRLAALLDSFRQISFDTSQRESRVCDLAEVVDRVASALGNVFRSKAIEYLGDRAQKCLIRSKDNLIAHVITILFSNAIDHGFEKDSYNLSGAKRIFTSLEIEETNIKVRIGNNGIPIPADAKSNLFEAFYTTQHNQGKNGLGLYIAQNIVTHDLKGILELEKSDETETIFALTLPKT